MTTVNPPGHVLLILRRLIESGYAAYLVGGCVRDSIMGRPVRDWDIATSATPVEVTRRFRMTALTGEKFGTVMVVLPEGAVEVTTFRTDGEYQDGRRPANVQFVTRIDDDLSRRDFTINAMAASITGEIKDIFGGIQDIENRVIRCVGDPVQRFGEDGLRMFRAFRLRAELGFTIDSNTLLAIGRSSDMARPISAERIRVELERTLLSQRPEVAAEMIGAGLLDKYLTGDQVSGVRGQGSGDGIQGAGGREQGSGDERRGAADLGGDACCLPDGLERLAALKELPPEPALRWCAFCAVLLDTGLIASVAGFLRGLTLDSKTIKTCAAALTVPGFPESSVEIKRLLAKSGLGAVRCAAAAHDTLHGKHGMPAPDIVQEERPPHRYPALKRTDEVLASGECYSLNGLAIAGRDLVALGYPQGRELGETLDAMLHHVIDRPEDNTYDTLLEVLRNRGENPAGAI